MWQTAGWLIFVVAIGSLPSPGLSLDQTEYCTNPAGKHGKCQPLRECLPLMRLLQQKPIPSEDLKFLRQSRCSASNAEDPLKLVCCPKDKLPRFPECGLGESDRIPGGQSTFLSEFPWTAIIEHRHHETGEIRQHCGATLISSRYALTAAHCVRSSSDEWEVIGVRLGEHDVSTLQDCTSGMMENFCAAAPLTVGIEKIVVHEGYSPLSKEHYDDIALIRFDKEIEFSEDVAPICLPVEESDRSQNITGTWRSQSVGWGLSTSGSASQRKLKVTLKVLDRMSCNKLDDIPLRDTQFCTEKFRDDREICSADSGGSLIMRGPSYRYNILYGIASFGKSDTCGTKEEPSVFTDVTKYIDWIEGNIEH